ncbi:MAG: VWA domain-containing protein, partial [Acidobacteria bacterium]|nr:VWA domain-containing protein [Acidobacteriota bacterium]
MSGRIRKVMPAALAAVLSAAIAGAFAAAAGHRMQQDPFRIQVQVEAVNLGVAVSDERGRFVSGLTADDFVVREDGIPQQISFFAAEAAPLTILVLLDASLSMRASLDYVKEAAATFVDRLWEGDRAMIGEFNDRVRFGGEFTDDRYRLVTNIMALDPLGPTALYDASILALERLYFADGDRKALLIFTDGDDSRSMGFGSEASAGDAIEAARLTDAVVYAIGFEGNGARVNKRFLRRLTEETGGQALFPERTGDLISSFARIEADMHAQYRLAYIPREAER